jgi:hypothetical protein
MADLDFPDSPSSGDKFFAGTKTMIFLSGKWKIVETQPATTGTVNGGDASDPEVNISAGVGASNFTGLEEIDCGAA